MTDESIVTDDSLNGAEDASNAFLKQWEDAETPSDPDEGAKEPTEEPEEDEEETGDETEADGSDDTEDEELIEEDDDTEDPQEPSYIDDDASLVKLTINGEEVEASVGDLKRLYGQEASITHKSQEVAAQRKAAEDHASHYKTALDTLVTRAEERYAPYAKIDFLVAAKQLEADELQALRQEATSAYNDLEFLKQEMTTNDEAISKAKGEKFLENAKAAVEYLSDPEKGVPGWNQALYDDLRTHSVSNGMEAEEFNKMTDPLVLKMMWKAMRYDKAKKVTSKKLKASPKKVLKSKAPGKANSVNKDAANEAMAKLQKSGSQEDAANAFLAQWAE